VSGSNPNLSLNVVNNPNHFRKLNIRTICEGIESPEEYQWAVRHGADYVQGYLFGRPSPVPETATMSAI
jgi:EAL domain-containing protein (putative c-di-GMP-specific phosphodiesterase class I)